MPSVFPEAKCIPSRDSQARNSTSLAYLLPFVRLRSGESTQVPPERRCIGHITIITMLGTVSYFNLILRREIKSAPAPNPNQDTRIYKTYLDGSSQYVGDPAREHFP